MSNLVDERLAWALAREATEERTLLAQEEILLVPDERTEFFFRALTSPRVVRFSRMHGTPDSVA